MCDIRAETAMCQIVCCYFAGTGAISEDGVGEQQTRRTGRCSEAGAKLTMARPPDDDGTEAYIDEAAIRIQGTVNVMMLFITAT